LKRRREGTSRKQLQIHGNPVNIPASQDMYNTNCSDRCFEK
jgi:hypothetical protein